MARADLCEIEAVLGLSFSPLMERRRAWIPRIEVSLLFLTCLLRK